MSDNKNQMILLYELCEGNLQRNDLLEISGTINNLLALESTFGALEGISYRVSLCSLNGEKSSFYRIDIQGESEKNLKIAINDSLLLFGTPKYYISDSDVIDGIRYGKRIS